MARLPCKTLLAGAVLLASVMPTLARQACSSERQRHLLAGVLNGEAVPTRKAQVAVAVIVFNRHKSGRYGSTLCQVMTAPGQFVPSWKGGPKMRMARANARLFIDEYHRHGRITTDGYIVAKLSGKYRFHAASYRGPWRRRGINIGDNIFY